MSRFTFYWRMRARWTASGASRTATIFSKTTLRLSCRSSDSPFQQRDEEPIRVEDAGQQPQRTVRHQAIAQSRRARRNQDTFLYQRFNTRLERNQPRLRVFSQHISNYPLVFLQLQRTS